MGGKVKWDAAADQVLLAKILDTHDVSVDSADPGSMPTARAIKERIFKIRELAKTASTGPSGSQSPAATRKPATPRKPASVRKGAKASENITPTPTSSRKRKRIIPAEESEVEKSNNEGDESKYLFDVRIKEEPTSGPEEDADSDREE
ncbi:hypothetical protein N7508_004960 [Penicillium antarcticum]|uniref:uncharacterized protein n=1 Tax=Penicillium antarcticum TaxID=416450 RepID=UPI0023973E40|nr:uncharacterized protein N7508_004960 [Penicillium antarcticum]KAJ5305945.1 hypothetical protein N7508_004960 [Penicillium antarcticum]